MKLPLSLRGAANEGALKQLLEFQKTVKLLLGGVET